ncbi:MAG: hypothetical protein PF505_01200 [Vallitaleaceae bacterium]|nr:hypothetical protein [Vallitaleaceae bacterium]
MNRLTIKTDGSKHYMTGSQTVVKCEMGYEGEAIDRLAMYENVYEALIEKYENTIKEMEKLRKHNKTKTVMFKQLLVDKVSTKNMIMMFDIYGI